MLADPGRIGALGERGDGTERIVGRRYKAGNRHAGAMQNDGGERFRLYRRWIVAQQLERQCDVVDQAGITVDYLRHAWTERQADQHTLRGGRSRWSGSALAYAIHPR